MPLEEALDDDYIISLLTKDSEANKKRYLASGLGPLLSKRRSENAPKPNTRFLKNIINDADAHNAALKAKEEQEAAAKLKDLKRKRHREERPHRVEKRWKGEEQKGRWARALGGLGERSGNESIRGGSGRRAREDRSHRPRRSPDRSAPHSARSDDDTHESCRRKRHDGEKRVSNERRASRSPRKRSPRGIEDDDELSDPLDDIIGPRPPPKVRPRGRGAYRDNPSMDTKFDPGYDPKTDVDLASDDDERDEWDMALEALRDRAKWRKSGGERLRRAGFSEAEVKKWEGDSGLLRQDGEKREKDVEDVKWTKKGEAREWDQGKTLGKDGSVELRASWA